MLEGDGTEHTILSPGRGSKEQSACETSIGVVSEGASPSQSELLPQPGKQGV